MTCPVTPLTIWDGNLLRALLAKFLLTSPGSSSAIQDRLRWIQTAKEITPSLAVDGGNYLSSVAALG